MSWRQKRDECDDVTDGYMVLRRIGETDLSNDGSDDNSFKSNKMRDVEGSVGTKWVKFKLSVRIEVETTGEIPEVLNSA